MYVNISLRISSGGTVEDHSSTYLLLGVLWLPKFPSLVTALARTGPTATVAIPRLKTCHGTRFGQNLKALGIHQFELVCAWHSHIYIYIYIYIYIFTCYFFIYVLFIHFFVHLFIYLFLLVMCFFGAQDD